MWLERLTDEVVTVLGSIPASEKVESEGVADEAVLNKVHAFKKIQKIPLLTLSLFKHFPSTWLYLSDSIILLVARLSKSDKRIVAQHSVSSYLAATNASPPSPSPAINNGGGIVVRSLCRIAASERCLRRYSVSFRGDSAAESSEWPSSADRLAVTTTASKADEDDELKGQCHQNYNPMQKGL